MLHARKQHAKNRNAETQRKRFVGKVDETNQDERAAVCDVAEKNQSENKSHIHYDRISKSISKFRRWAIVYVKEQCIAYSCTRH